MENPFEDPDADLYGKKVKDYKIVERKEEPEQKPAEPLEKKVESEAQKRVLESLRKEYKKERSFLRHGILYTAVCAGIAAYGIIKNEGLIATVASFPTVAVGVTTYFIGGGVVELKKKIGALERELTKEGS